MQVSLIAVTLDKTRSQLSSSSTGAINSLTQIDRNLDRLLGALIAHRFAQTNAVEQAAKPQSMPAYRDGFEIFWASATVLNLRTPGSTMRMPAASELLEDTREYLNAWDPLVNGDEQLSREQTTQMYEETLVISERFHNVAHEYFLELSVFSDELKDRTQTLYLTFLGFAAMVLACGGVSLYSLFKANRKSEQLIERANITQTRLTQVVDELRSGKLESKAKDSFLAAASHDLRQPLHALGLFLGALEKHVQPTGHHIMKKAQESSSALTKLLSSLLDLSRLDAGAVRVQRRSFNVGKLITRLEHEFQPTAVQRGITLQFDKKNCHIFSDRILIDRVLRNLIENALTHSHGETIKLDMAIHSGNVSITVRDDGIGIPENKRDDIFSEYFQIGNPERDRSKGLGIGLAIVKRLSELLELDLRLISGKGTGCAFTINVPQSTANSVTSVAVENANPAATPNIVIGIIEDAQEVRDGMELMLDSKGYTTLIADSATSLLKVLKQTNQCPDVLVSDYRLRHGTTGDVAIKAVMDQLGRDIPSVIITGDTSPKRVKELTGSGHKLMHKPVEPQDLLSMIEGLAESTEHRAKIA